MNELVKKWTERADHCRELADKTQNEMTEQGYLAEAHSLELCASELGRAIAHKE